MSRKVGSDRARALGLQASSAVSVKQALPEDLSECRCRSTAWHQLAPTSQQGHEARRGDPGKGHGTGASHTAPCRLRPNQTADSPKGRQLLDSFAVLWLQSQPWEPQRLCKSAELSGGGGGSVEEPPGRASICQMAIMRVFIRESTEAGELPCGENSRHKGPSLMPALVSAVIIALIEGKEGRKEIGRG